jgi:hypothetical protein
MSNRSRLWSGRVAAAAAAARAQALVAALLCLFVAMLTFVLHLFVLSF